VYAPRHHSQLLGKGTAIPYVAHLLQVAGLVLEAGGDEDLAIAGLLHEVSSMLARERLAGSEPKSGHASDPGCLKSSRLSQTRTRYRSCRGPRSCRNGSWWPTRTSMAFPWSPANESERANATAAGVVNGSSVRSLRHRRTAAVVPHLLGGLGQCCQRLDMEHRHSSAAPRPPTPRRRGRWRGGSRPERDHGAGPPLLPVSPLQRVQEFAEISDRLRVQVERPPCGGDGFGPDASAGEIEHVGEVVPGPVLARPLPEKGHAAMRKPAS
jgi:hypothetical protein